MLHVCIKCSKQYEDDEIDAYYCPECVKEKNAIAKEIDEKMKGKQSKTVVSALQEYDNAQKVHGFVQVRL